VVEVSVGDDDVGNLFGLDPNLPELLRQRHRMVVLGHRGGPRWTDKVVIVRIDQD